METDNITILEEDLEVARSICAKIKDPLKRSKAVSNILASLIAKKFLDTNNYDVDTDSGLHNIPTLVDDYEISDIYLNNKSIFARVHFSDEELCIPKLHYDLGILPFVYMFIKLDTDLKNATLTGFIRPCYVDTDSYVGNVYPIQKEHLISFYDIESNFKSDIDVNEIDVGTMYDLLDNVLSEEKKAELILTLMSSKYNRLKLIKIAKSLSVFNFVSISDTAVIPQETDSTLDEILDINDSDEQDAIIEEFAFSTEVTPSSAGIMEDIDNNSMYSGSSNENNDFIDIFLEQAEEEQIQSVENNADNPIENLFDKKQSSVPIGRKKKSNGAFVIILVLLIMCGIGYFYIYKQDSSLDEGLSHPNTLNSTKNDDVQPVNIAQSESTEQTAMPVETVENKIVSDNKEDAVAVSIPEIEHNLDASILVSNLKVDWEVPEGYTANTSAKRYLVKLGKIIQLNLKSELLLLNKPPLSNTIAVELKYDSGIGKFDISKIKTSSGDKSIDKNIETVIKSALNLNIKTNMDSFAKIKGNPVIIIRL